MRPDRGAGPFPRPDGKIRHKHAGAEPTQTGGSQEGNGNTANQAAHAVQQAVIDQQLRAKPQCSGEQPAKHETADQHAPVCTGKGLIHGKGACRDEEDAQRSGTEYRAVGFSGIR